MRLISSLSGDSVPDCPFPIPSIIEDDDGFRILLTSGIASAHELSRASELGMSFIYDISENVATYLDKKYELPPIPSFAKLVATIRDDEPASSRFVHLHTHSEYSGLDGFSKISEIIPTIKADGQSAVAITDHGTCAGHPEMQILSEEYGVKAILGIEAYFVDDRFRRPIGLHGRKRSEMGEEELTAHEKDTAEVKDYWHLILLAENDVGLRNIWAMSTEANRDGYYRHPRMDWDTLQRHSEGVICLTACLRGPVSQAILHDDLDLAVGRTSRLKAIFQDRLYMEIHTNSEPDQEKANIGLVAIGQHLGIPVVAVSDSHYSCHDHKDAHNVWIAAQTGGTVNDDAGMFSGDADYHLFTEDEVRKALDYLPNDVVSAAIEETGRVADRCEVSLKRNPAPPRFKTDGTDVESLLALCMSNWDRRMAGKTSAKSEYIARFEKEMRLLIDKRFCGYFLMVADYVLWAKSKGILVGPARGSGGGSLVAYLCGINELDPVEHNLLFERFMTEGRTELPDFDMDFPSSRIDEVYQYVIDRWGEDYVVRVGTHLRLKNKGVIRKLATALGDVNWGDVENISKIIDAAEANSAGLGVSWDELWKIHEDKLAPYREKYPTLMHYADLFVGRLNAYGKHAAGVVISPEETLADRLPLRIGDDGRFISEFDMNALASMGLVKFDFLGIRTLDTLQVATDLVQERHGVKINFYDWREEYDDSAVWDLICSGYALGIFQVETSAGTRTARLVQPRSVAELADVITLDRPGPQRSGLDKTYMARRNGQERISYPDPRLATVLDRSYGVMIYQEDIMQTCMVLAGYTSEEADHVRKILGKKKVEEAKIEGRKFVSASIGNGMDPEAAEALWELMEEFARYAFNRSHAFGYAVISYWTAWMKHHYSVEFFTACLSTVDKKRIGDFIVDAKRVGIDVIPPDINRSGVDFTPVEGGILYGLGNIKGIGTKAQSLVEGQPYSSIEDLQSRVTVTNTGASKKMVDSGTIRTLNRVGAFESIHPNRKAVEAMLDADAVKPNQKCTHFDESASGPPSGCTFDWSSEPVTIGKRGNPLKPKPIPKRCTVSCRHYEERERAAPDVDPYSSEKIREFEMELLGNYLSSTPFDVLNEEYPAEVKKASELESYEFYEKTLTAGIVKKMTEKVDRNGKTFGLVSLFAQDGMLEAVCFHDSWKSVKSKAHLGDLVLAMTKKTHRGYQIIDVESTKEIKI